MVLWALVIVVLAILSYLADIGIFSVLRDIRVPGLEASVMSVLLLLCGLGMLTSLGHSAKKEAVGKPAEKSSTEG